MFDLGIQEIIVIFVVALLVFGPNRLPEVGVKVGKIIRKIKVAFYDVKRNINEQIDDTYKPYNDEFSDLDKKIKDLSIINRNNIEKKGDDKLNE
ncbi:MAG: Sec-independent protein translocase protein TatB [Candidatus Magnetoovum sp. WYHC-5]|nr:Sec-independent protein translocase protein TatB [Candidatus Magnetoovum sp. WYHC-5]